MMRQKHAAALALGLWIASALGPSPALGAENIDPDDIGAQYAWSENAGWLNAELDTDGDGTPDEGVTVGDDELLGWLWSENAGWVSLSCTNTGSCATAAYGVANDGCGQLSGSAWSENAGWIRFSHAEGGVVIDPKTGLFSGEAWAENLGWIRFRGLGVVDYGVETAWTRAPPGGSPSLDLSHDDPTTTLSWSALADASVYDVVEGDLDALHVSGDLAATVTGCPGEDLAGTSATHSATPAPSEGLWFLVRGENCGGAGSYDGGGGGQSEPRDAAIGSSLMGCE